MSFLRKVALVAALALASVAPAAGFAFSANIAHTVSAHSAASHSYVTADGTPNTVTCGGGNSGHC